MRAALLLAGGRSRRFGRDKAVAPFRGRPLALWSLDRLRAYAGGGGTALAGPEDLARRLGVEPIADAEGLEGPLAGVLAGLAWAAARGADTLATAPCDTPFLPADLHVELEGRLREAGAAPCALARAERPHPLCAVWRVPAAPTLLADLAAAYAEARGPRLEDLLVRLGAAEARFPDEGDFANLNTAEEFERAARPIPG